MKKFLKGAVVLLIAITLVFSTVAIADTNNEKTLQTWAANPIKPTTIVNPNGENSRGPVVWDNGEPSATSNLFSSQFDDCYPFISQVADDFHFEETTEVADVHWWGGFWGGDPIECIDFYIYFYKDDGTGTAPTGGGLDDPSVTAIASYFFPDVCGVVDPNGIYEYEVVLNPPIVFEPCYKYWIAIQAVFCYPPQWGWANTDGIQLHSAVQGFPLLGTPFWTPIDPEVDMAFQLTSEECEPCIDVEKYVWDPEYQEWVDADTKDTALDVAKCDEITYKIVIHNCGTVELYDIVVKDKMHKSVKYIASDPPGEHYFEDPFHYIEWFFPGPLYPCETIEIYITAHVEGPECSYDENYVLVEAYGCGNIVRDDDSAWIHVKGCGIPILRPFLYFLEAHPNMFPLLQKMLQRFGVL